MCRWLSVMRSAEVVVAEVVVVTVVVAASVPVWLPSNHGQLLSRPNCRHA